MQQSTTLYYPLKKEKFKPNELEDAFYESKLIYSLLHLTILSKIPEESSLEALKKAIRVCYLAGVNSNHHFKQIYLFDTAIKTLRVDWRISKRGLNLIVTQTPLLNDKTATWLWKLSEDKTI